MPRPSSSSRLALVLAALALAAGCGGGDAGGEAGPAAAASPRTVEVEMVDLAFEPDRLEVASGETVRFVFTNSGVVRHDAFIGGDAAQLEHAASTAGGGAHDHGADEAAVSVAPGATAELVHTFDQPGEVEIGCHQPGHYEAGMKVVVTVR